MHYNDQCHFGKEVIIQIQMDARFSEKNNIEVNMITNGEAIPQNWFDDNYIDYSLAKTQFRMLIQELVREMASCDVVAEGRRKEEALDVKSFPHN